MGWTKPGVDGGDGGQNGQGMAIIWQCRTMGNHGFLNHPESILGDSKTTYCSC